MQSSHYVGILVLTLLFTAAFAAFPDSSAATGALVASGDYGDLPIIMQMEAEDGDDDSADKAEPASAASIPEARSAPRVSAKSQGDSPKYNIVLIVTDDQRWDTLDNMTTVQNILVKEGVLFTNGTVETPLCCPSRATILTGLYTHNHRVEGNHGPRGGADNLRNATIAEYLKAAGYHTALVGKYMNEYGKISPYIPPGWDGWYVFASPEKYYNFILNENGVHVFYGKSEANYSTDVLARKAVKIINETPGETPLFLYFSTAAPHASAPPAKRHQYWFRNKLQPWRPPSFNEANVSDKPKWLQAKPLLNNATIKEIDTLRRNQLESLLAVDDAVANITDALNRTGRFNNTLFIYISDNGYMWGEHRLVKKGKPFEESIRVPFIVRMPGVDARRDNGLVQTTDIAATLADIAGVEFDSDGMSMVPLLLNSSSKWREAVLIENFGTTPKFQAVRTQRYLYAEHGDGSREFYDLQTDPYQLENGYSNPENAEKIAELKSLLDDLRKNVSLVITPEANVTFSLGKGNAFSPNNNGIYDTIKFNITASEKVHFMPVYLLNESGRRVTEFTQVRNVTSVSYIWNGKCKFRYCTGPAPDGVYKIEIKIFGSHASVNATNMTEVIILNRTMD